MTKKQHEKAYRLFDEECMNIPEVAERVGITLREAEKVSLEQLENRAQEKEAFKNLMRRLGFVVE